MRLASWRISAAFSEGKKNDAELPDGVLPQNTSNSSGTVMPDGGAISNGCGIRRESATPGFGPSIQAMFALGELVRLAVVRAGGTGVSS